MNSSKADFQIAETALKNILALNKLT